MYKHQTLFAMIIQGAYQLCGGDDARAMLIAGSRSILAQETSDTRNIDTDKTPFTYSHD